MFSSRYFAPEVFNGLLYSERADIWALGITMYFMLTATLPWGDAITKDQIRRKIETMSTTEILSPLRDNSKFNVSSSAINVMECCLQHQLENRWSVQAIRCHPWCELGCEGKEKQRRKKHLQRSPYVDSELPSMSITVQKTISSDDLISEGPVSVDGPSSAEISHGRVEESNEAKLENIQDHPQDDSFVTRRRTPKLPAVVRKSLSQVVDNSVPKPSPVNSIKRSGSLPLLGWWVDISEVRKNPSVGFPVASIFKDRHKVSLEDVPGGSHQAFFVNCRLAPSVHENP